MGCETINSYLVPEEQIHDVDRLLDLLDFDRSDTIDINEFFEVRVVSRWGERCGRSADVLCVVCRRSGCWTCMTASWTAPSPSRPMTTGRGSTTLRYDGGTRASYSVIGAPVVIGAMMKVAWGVVVASGHPSHGPPARRTGRWGHDEAGGRVAR